MSAHPPVEKIVEGSNRGDVPLRKISEIQCEIRHALPVLRARCLQFSAKWLSEQALGIATEDAAVPTAAEGCVSGGSKSQRCILDNNLLSLAHSYINLREYSRAANLLENETSLAAKYYNFYSLLMTYQREVELVRPQQENAFQEKEVPEDVEDEEDTYASLDNKWGYQKRSPQPKSNSKFVTLCAKFDEFWDEVLTSKNLKRIEDVIDMGSDEHGFREDVAFLAYVHGSCLQMLRVEAQAGTMERARGLLLVSLSIFPLNWSAWLSLLDTWTFDEEEKNEGRFGTQGEELGTSLIAIVDSYPQLRGSWMRDFFEAKLRLEFNQNSQAQLLLKKLKLIFPSSIYLEGEEAYAFYLMREFEEAEKRYAAVLKKEKHRREVMDIYSHILYVQQKRNKLAQLARQASEEEKYTAEGSSVIGNYYSLRGDREKAILYFRRAVMLNGRYVSGWTLMGHEYVEKGNAGAAVQAYRSAIDVSGGRDFRAWYSAGQAYELMHMPLRAVYYYSQAVRLRPFDSRMWAALASCLFLLKRTELAIAAFSRGAMCEEDDGLCSLKLGHLFLSIGNRDAAAGAFAVALGDESNPAALPTTVPGVRDAYHFLIKYHSKRFDEKLVRVYALRLENETVDESVSLNVRDATQDSNSVSMELGDSTFLSSLSDSRADSFRRHTPSASSMIFSTPVTPIRDESSSISALSAMSTGNSLDDFDMRMTGRRT